MVEALPVPLSPEQAQGALGAVLEAMRGTTDPSALTTLAPVVEALAPKLSPEMEASMLPVMRSGLNAASTAQQSIAWAGALEALLLSQPEGGYIRIIVEVLKYPSSTITYDINNLFDDEPRSATEFLLKKMRERFPNVRKLPDGSLDNILTWIAKTYPEIDLTSPPERPAPLVEVVSSLQLS